MSRGLDHIVHAVPTSTPRRRSIAGSASRSGRATSMPGAPTTISSSCPDSSSSCSTVAEPEKLGGEGFAALFGRFNQAFLARQQGLSFLMLESQDAAADARDFAAAGIAASAALHVRARGHAARRQQAQGRLLARLRARCRRSGHRVCDLPAAQSGEFLESVIAAASKRRRRGRRRSDRRRESERPSHLPVRLHGRARAASPPRAGSRRHTPRGELQIMDAAAFRSHFGVAPPDIAAGARLAALRLMVRDRDALIGRRSRPARSRIFCIWAMWWSRRRPRWGRLWCSRPP